MDILLPKRLIIGGTIAIVISVMIVLLVRWRDESNIDAIMNQMPDIINGYIEEGNFYAGYDYLRDKARETIARDNEEVMAFLCEWDEKLTKAAIVGCFGAYSEQQDAYVYLWFPGEEECGGDYYYYIFTTDEELTTAGQIREACRNSPEYKVVYTEAKGREGSISGTLSFTYEDTPDVPVYLTFDVAYSYNRDTLYVRKVGDLNRIRE